MYKKGSLSKKQTRDLSNAVDCELDFRQPLEKRENRLLGFHLISYEPSDLEVICNYC